MTLATAVPVLFTSFVYCTNMYWSVIHGIKRKPHLSVVWNWYHWVAIAILHQPRPTDSADINTRLQLSDTSSIPPMHGGFLLITGIHFGKTYLSNVRASSFITIYNCPFFVVMMDNCSNWGAGHIAVHIDGIQTILLRVHFVISIATTVFVDFMTCFRKTINGCFW